MDPGRADYSDPSKPPGQLSSLRILATIGLLLTAAFVAEWWSGILVWLHRLG